MKKKKVTSVEKLTFDMLGFKPTLELSGTVSCSNLPENILKTFDPVLLFTDVGGTQQRPKFITKQMKIASPWKP